MSWTTSSSVAIDTNLLIYFLEPRFDEELHQRARALMEQWFRTGVLIALPIPVAAEYLSGAFQTQHDAPLLEELYRRLAQNFVLLAFDEQAARIYARIMLQRSQDGVWQRLRAQGEPRRCLVADVAILATAAAHRVPALYTAEKRRTLANLAQAAGLDIQVHYLQDLPWQPPLI